MSNLLTAEGLQSFFAHTSFDLLITIGNSFRSDDGVGPYIASQVQSSSALHVLDAADTPENLIDEALALKPKKILFIDAADFGGSPGEIQQVDAAHIPETTLSTHTISLKVIARILEAEAKAEIQFLGIQPRQRVAR